MAHCGKREWEVVKGGDEEKVASANVKVNGTEIPLDAGRQEAGAFVQQQTIRVASVESPAKKQAPLAGLPAVPTQSRAFRTSKA